MHWGYVFAVLGRYYGFSPQVVLSLTPTQTRHYLAMVPFVSEWSEDAGIVPPLPAEYLDTERLAERARRWGLSFRSGQTDNPSSQRNTAVPKEEEDAERS